MQVVVADLPNGGASAHARLLAQALGIDLLSPVLWRSTTGYDEDGPIPEGEMSDAARRDYDAWLVEAAQERDDCVVDSRSAPYVRPFSESAAATAELRILIHLESTIAQRAQGFGPPVALDLLERRDEYWTAQADRLYGVGFHTSNAGFDIKLRIPDDIYSTHHYLLNYVRWRRDSPRDHVSPPSMPLVGCIVCRDDGAILLVHRNQPWSRQWELPGGPLRDGDAVRSGLHELQREIGIVGTSTRLLGETTFRQDEQVYSCRWLLVADYSGEPTTVLRERFDRHDFFSPDAIFAMRRAGELSANTANLSLALEQGHISLTEGGTT